MLSALANNLKEYNFSKQDSVMLKYAKQVTENKIKENIIKELREEGFDDAGIHDICAVTAYFNFVNRIANGLNVEIETK